MALGSKYTKGIEIEIGGNTTGLKVALDAANKSIKTTQTELDTLKNSLKLEWNADNFKRAQELAQRSIEQTKAKADTLRKALAELDKQGDGKDAEKYEAIRRELSYVEVAAQKAEQQLANINKVQFEGLKQSLNDAAHRLDALGNKLTVGLTAPLAAAGTASVNFASDTAEAVNKVEVAFSYAAEGVKKWSDTTLTSIGLAKGTALDMAALYGDMATSMGFADAQAADMSTTLVNLAADLSSFKNISIDQSNTALKSIFTGETESLKNLGVVMTEANLKAYALAEGFGKSYDSMSQAEKVAVRYQYVLDQTKNAQGDFARTFDGTANQLRVFRESLKEAAATAGEELLPIITPIISNLSKLVQSFGDLDEGTRKAVVQAGLFLAALGPMLKLTGGVTSAVNAGITAYNTLKTALAGATAAQTGLNAAMNANPVGIIVTVLGTLVSVLLSYAAATALTTEKTESLNKQIRDTKKAYEESTAAIQAEKSQTLDMLSSLEALAAAEDKTAAQKAAIKAQVDALNEAVPGLTLAYNEEADALNLSVESMRRRVQAAADMEEMEGIAGRLNDLSEEGVLLADQEREAKSRLAAAERNLAEAEATLTENTEENNNTLIMLRTSLLQAKTAVKENADALEQNRLEAEGLNVRYDELSRSVSDTTDTLRGAADGASQAADQYAALKNILEGVQGGYELLAKAQKETAESGYLSISTVSTLLEKYPELTGYLVEAEGGYRLAEGALQNYIAAQRTEYQLAYDSAASAAQAIVDAEISKGVQIDTTTQAIKDQIQALAVLYQTKAEAAASTDWKNSDEYLILGNNPLTGSEDYKKAQAYMDAYNRLAAAEKELAGFDRAAASLARDNAGRSGGSSSKSASGAEKDTAMEELKAWLADMDHQIYLWGKEGGREAAIAGAYQDMQEAVHKLAEEYRARGYGETSDEIQQLQKLWWGYSDALEKQNQEAYARELSALETSLENEKITTEEYLSARAGLQAKYLTEGTAAWEAETSAQNEKRKQLNQAAYKEELADLAYFRDMGIVTEAQYYVELADLRNRYLEENSTEWRRATVELHNYLEKCREEELAAAQKAYENQLQALKQSLDQRLDEAKKAYDAQVDAIKSAYGDQTSAIKQSFSAQKAALKEGYDQAKEAAKAAYEEKKKAVQEELRLEKDRLNAVLEGIDAEIQARRELREDEDLDDQIAAARKRLEAAQAQREYARTDEDRAEWDKEILRLKEALDKAVRDKEDTEFYREKELEKETVRDQIAAAGDKAEAALAELKTGYDAQVKKLEADYKSSLAALESRQETALAQAEADYQAKLAQAEADYQRRVEQLQADHDSSVSRLEDRLAQAEQRANQKEYSDEVRAIARENDVDLGVAQDMYNANQWYKDKEGYTPYSDGGYSAGKAAAAAAGAVGAALAGMVTSVSRTVEKTVKNSASVTIHQASSLTEGQVARTVRKVLDEMGR